MIENKLTKRELGLYSGIYKTDLFIIYRTNRGGYGAIPRYTSYGRQKIRVRKITYNAYVKSGQVKEYKK